MKKLFYVLAAPLVLAACGGTVIDAYPDAWQKQKAACVGGDYAACADIGHQARAAHAAPRPEKVVISHPIVD